MMKLPARLAAVLLLWALVVTIAAATTSLSFSEGGYWIDMEIGHDESRVVASIRVHVPGDHVGVRLRGHELSVDVFDTDQRQLIIRYDGEHPELGPFILTVQGCEVTLNIDGLRIASSFSWFM